jgi:hypothetical protein
MSKAWNRELKDWRKGSLFPQIMAILGVGLKTRACVKISTILSNLWLENTDARNEPSGSNWREYAKVVDWLFKE